nr:MAG TPA: RNA-directed RNA polymerase catalytic subunit [Caudoviricetes sp.]
MKINSYNRIKGKITDVKPNFEKVEGKLLDEMYSKCCLAFKKQFPR